MRAPVRLRVLLIHAVLLTCGAARVHAQQPAQTPAPAPAPAQPAAEAAEYRKTIDEAVLEFRAGHWEEARALFGRAHQIEPSARTLRGLGMTAFELRMYVQSLRELEAALQDARKPLDAGMRSAAQELIAKAREFVAHVRIVPSPATATLLIDGRQPLPEADAGVLLDAGSHVVSATADGYKPTSLRFAVEGGRDQVLQLPLEPILSVVAVPAIDPNRPAPAPQPEPAITPAPAPEPAQPARPAPAKRSPLIGTLAWVTLGGAVAFGGGAAAAWLIGDENYDHLGECSPRCTDEEIDDSGVATTDTLTNVFAGIAIASGVASGVLFAIALSDSEEENADPSVALGVTPGGVHVQGAF